MAHSPIKLPLGKAPLPNVLAGTAQSSQECLLSNTCEKAMQYPRCLPLQLLPTGTAHVHITTRPGPHVHSRHCRQTEASLRSGDLRCSLDPCGAVRSLRPLACPPPNAQLHSLDSMMHGLAHTGWAHQHGWLSGQHAHRVWTPSKTLGTQSALAGMSQHCMLRLAWTGGIPEQHKARQRKVRQYDTTGLSSTP